MVAPGGRRASLVRRASLLTRLIVPVLALAAAACDKVPLTAPTGSTITLFSSTTTVPVYGTATITASVIEQAGTAVQNGTVVSFTTSLGSIEPAEAQTQNGQVTVRFTAGGQSGTAVVSAYSGGANSGSTSSSGGTGGTTSGTGKAATLEIKVGAAAAGRIVLAASPTSVPELGGTADLVATVFDNDGNRLPGVPVAFTATAGSVRDATVVSNSLGEARTTVTTNRETTVTASAGGSGGTSGALSAQVTIKTTTAPTVRITAPATITAGQPASFTIAVTTGTNGSPIREVTVDFGDGTLVSLGAVSESTTVSHVYTRDGAYTVSATAVNSVGDRTTASTAVTVSPASPVSLVVSFLPAAPRVNQTVTVSATISPETAIASSYQYSFGDGSSVTLTSGSTSHVYTTTGIKVITVTVTTTSGQEGTGRAEVNVLP